ncbi:MAG: hypothetical protein HFE78_08540 [Clostridiales bacterium]|nr:hypothetical protein [Clostridiales bacterium]
MIQYLPKSLDISGLSFEIYTDFRDILVIMEAFEDPSLTYQDKVYVTISNLYREPLPNNIDTFDAYKKALWFLNGGNESDNDVDASRLMSWSQDFSLLAPAIDKVAGEEVREKSYLHWWTFLGYYQEIGDCVFSNYIAIRYKLQKGIPLNKQEKEILRNNRSDVLLRTQLSENEQAQEDEFFYGG